MLECYGLDAPNAETPFQEKVRLLRKMAIKTAHNGPAVPVPMHPIEQQGDANTELSLTAAGEESMPDTNALGSAVVAPPTPSGRHPPSTSSLGVSLIEEDALEFDEDN